MDVAVNNITTTITIPQVDFNLLKDLAKKFGWVIQTENKSGIEEALDDVKLGRPQFRNCFKKSLVGLKIVIMMSWGFI